MRFNYGSEKKKFDAIWKRLEKEYEEAGMSCSAIEEMKDYDWEIFKQERKYCNHNQKINEKLFEDGDEIEENKHPILKKYIESFACEDKPFMNRKHGWIELLDHDEITVFLKAYPEKLEILTEYVFNDKNQSEIAVELGISQAALSQQMKTIRKNLKKFL